MATSSGFRVVYCRQLFGVETGGSELLSVGVGGAGASLKRCVLFGEGVLQIAIPGIVSKVVLVVGYLEGLQRAWSTGQHTPLPSDRTLRSSTEDQKAGQPSLSSQWQHVYALMECLALSAETLSIILGDLDSYTPYTFYILDALISRFGTAEMFVVEFLFGRTKSRHCSVILLLLYVSGSGMFQSVSTALSIAIHCSSDQALLKLSALMPSSRHRADTS